MRLVIAEKPSVAMNLAKVLGAGARRDGYTEGNGWLVSWCVGHLVTMSIRRCTIRGLRSGALRPCLLYRRNSSMR